MAIFKNFLEDVRFVTLVAGAANDSIADLAAYYARVKAGVGDLNLIQISSVLPPGVQLAEKIELPDGSIVMAAEAKISSKACGELISVAIGIGFARDDESGLIMVYHGNYPEAEALALVIQLTSEGCSARNNHSVRIKSIATSIRVEHGKTACAFAAAVLF
jgi:arginine decarboxylase